MKSLSSAIALVALLVVGCGGPDPELPPERPYGATEVSCPELWPAQDANVDVDLLPEVIIKPEPEYPDVHKAQGIEDTVMVKVLVDCNGQVADLILAESSNYQRMDDNALEAAARMEFRPAIRDNMPAPVWVVYPFVYELPDEDEQ